MPAEDNNAVATRSQLFIELLPKKATLQHHLPAGDCLPACAFIVVAQRHIETIALPPGRHDMHQAAKIHKKI